MQKINLFITLINANYVFQSLIISLTELYIAVPLTLPLLGARHLVFGVLNNEAGHVSGTHLSPLSIVLGGNWGAYLVVTGALAIDVQQLVEDIRMLVALVTALFLYVYRDFFPRNSHIIVSFFNWRLCSLQVKWRALFFIPGGGNMIEIGLAILPPTCWRLRQVVIVRF